MSALQSYDFGKFRRAVVMGYSIRLIWGIYRAVKLGQLKVLSNISILIHLIINNIKNREPCHHYLHFYPK